MHSSSFIRRSADALLQIFIELEANTALDKHDPAFIGSLRRRIRELEIRGPYPPTGRADVEQGMAQSSQVPA